MPKLFQLNATLGRGSTGRIAEMIANQAKKAGWVCYMAHGPRSIGNSEMLSYQVSDKIEVLFHYMQSRLFDRHGLGSCNATRRLIKHIESINPDVVHIHNIHGYYANYKMLFRYLAEEGIPTVMTMHDFWLMTGHCAYINKSCNKWITGCGKCPRLGEYPAALCDHSRKNLALKNALYSAFDRNKLIIVPVSNWLKGYAKRSILSDCQFEVIQNGVDTKVFKPFEDEHSDIYKRIDWSKYTIITVADRWTEANGFNDIIELGKSLPDRMQILMVGLNDQQIQGLPEKIVGINHTDNVEQLIELYTTADVLFNASKEVTFGLVTSEAMACGTPAIVFKDTAGEEIIDDKTGFVVENLGEIPELVVKCRNNAEFYKNLCRQRIVENFDSISQYSKYVNLYNSLLKAKS